MFYSYLKVRTRTLIQSKQSEMELWTHTSRATVSALSGSAVPCKKKRELTLVLWIYSRRCRRVQMFSVSPSGRRPCPSLSHRSWTSLDRPEPQSPPSPAPLTKHTQFKKQKQDVKDLKWVVASVWIISCQPVKEALTVHHPVTLGHFDVDQLLKQTAQSWRHFQHRFNLMSQSTPPPSPHSKPHQLRNPEPAASWAESRPGPSEPGRWCYWSSACSLPSWRLSRPVHSTEETSVTPTRLCELRLPNHLLFLARFLARDHRGETPVRYPLTSTDHNRRL